MEHMSQYIITLARIKYTLRPYKPWWHTGGLSHNISPKIIGSTHITLGVLQSMTFPSKGSTHFIRISMSINVRTHNPCFVKLLSQNRTHNKRFYGIYILDPILKRILYQVPLLDIITISYLSIKSNTYIFYNTKNRSKSDKSSPYLKVGTNPTY